MISIFEIIDQTSHKKTLFFDEIKRVFILIQKNGTEFQNTYDTSPAEISELVNHFQGSLRDKQISVLEQELNYLIQNNIWEDEKKLKVLKVPK